MWFLLRSRSIQISRYRQEPFKFRSLSSQSVSNAVLRIPKANVYRFGDGNRANPVFKNLEWTVKEGENWAIVGPAGSEKSDFLDVSGLSLCGAHPYSNTVPDALGLHARLPSSSQRTIPIPL